MRSPRTASSPDFRRAAASLRAASLAAALWGLMLPPASASAGSIPEASGPRAVYCFDSRNNAYAVGSSWRDVFNGTQYLCQCTSAGGSCKPVNGNSSGTSRPTTTRGSSPSSSRPHRPTTEEMALREFQKTIDQMFTPNPETLRKIQETRQEGDRSREASEIAQQSAEDQRRLTALRDAEAARQQQLLDLSGSLQGMPGASSGAAVDLRPGGTPFFGSGGAGGTWTGTSLEGLRAGASSGIDTRGGFAGDPPAPPPPVPPPTPVAAPAERAIPPEKLTPEMRSLMKERDELAGRRKELEGKLADYESKGTLTPEESKTMAKLRDDLGRTLNQIDYLNFTVNQSLDELPADGAPRLGGRQ